MAFLVLGANSVSGYTVKNSLRFNGSSSDYLNRNSNNNTEPTKVTWSFWTKRTTLTDTRRISMAMTSGFAKYHYIRFEDGILNIFNSAGTGYTLTQQFRDVGAWYHIVVSIDTTLATSADRVKVYVNGSQVTAFTSSTAPTQNAGIFIGETSNAPFVIGALYGVGYGISSGSPTEFYSGYMSEFYLIDGQALTPSSFGETDTDTGIWKPKAYSGTYGTNGFYLQFKNSASLGTDSSGNGNTFTVNNLTSIDQTTDTPTNNFATFNPLDKNTSITTSEGNLKITGTNDCKTTIGVSKGKWYCETKVTAVGATVLTGITFSSVDGSNHSAVDAKRIIYQETGYIYREATGNGSVNTGTTYTTSDIIGLALDCDNGTMKFYKNGTLIHTETNSVISGNEQMFYTYLGSSATVEMNFGNPSYSANSYTDGAGYGNFSYSVPSGYYALCTKNLANFG
jgi:hypothetical protein